MNLQDWGAIGEVVGALAAGVGEHVFFVRGSEAAFPFQPRTGPTVASIVGIIDHWHTD